MILVGLILLDRWTTASIIIVLGLLLSIATNLSAIRVGHLALIMLLHLEKLLLLQIGSLPEEDWGVWEVVRNWRYGLLWTIPSDGRWCLVSQRTWDFRLICSQNVVAFTVLRRMIVQVVHKHVVILSYTSLCRSVDPTTRCKLLIHHQGRCWAHQVAIVGYQWGCNDLHARIWFHKDCIWLLEVE